MQSVESFVRSRLIEATMNARCAFAVWDAETILAASKSLSAIADQMGKMPRPDSLPPIINESLLEELASDSEAQDDDDIGGGLKVESVPPEPSLPPGGMAVDPAKVLESLL